MKSSRNNNWTTLNNFGYVTLVTETSDITNMIQFNNICKQLQPVY